MEQKTGTIFKVYLLEKGDPHKQEGFIELWKHKGELQRIHNLPFDYLDKLPRKIRQLLRKRTSAKTI
ncbi:MAG: hypothetical protein WBQ76_01220 [Candidatus Korobacteraceae bacterium]